MYSSLSRRHRLYRPTSSSTRLHGWEWLWNVMCGHIPYKLIWAAKSLISLLRKASQVSVGPLPCYILSHYALYIRLSSYTSEPAKFCEKDCVCIILHRVNKDRLCRIRPQCVHLGAVLRTRTLQVRSDVIVMERIWAMWRSGWCLCWGYRETWQCFRAGTD